MQECNCNHVGVAGGVPEVKSKFHQEGEMKLLVARPQQRDPGHRRIQRFVVSEDLEFRLFKEEEEMSDSCVSLQQVMDKHEIADLG